MSDKKRILVVDDDPDFAFFVQVNLEKEGFAVEVAHNGRDALEKVRTNSPDAIVLDVIMPEKDGYSVCSELKGDEQYAEIPIVMLTCAGSRVSATGYTHADGMNMEAEDYLPKPASSEEIIKSIKRHLKL